MNSPASLSAFTSSLSSLNKLCRDSLRFFFIKVIFTGRARRSLPSPVCGTSLWFSSRTISSELKKELGLFSICRKVDQIADPALLRITNPPKNLPFLTRRKNQPLQRPRRKRGVVNLCGSRSGAFSRLQSLDFCSPPD